jgi:hypothetical protein
MTEPESEDVIRVGHLALSNGQLAVIYINEGRIEIPVYPPRSDGPLNEAGEVEPVTVVDLTAEEAHQFAEMIDRAVERAADDGRVGERGDETPGGLLDTALAAAAEVERRFNHILPGELQELSDRLATAAVAWKAFLDAELARWRPLRLIKNEEGAADDEDRTD